eukprot:TRINITY_DN5553_c0_g1_i1.p2 TRINITY_DN5553_c0_g1~~TRINITY_DN5553_c0_g1_i1.p2  ORF type:complete len:199 (-),score=16.63 TRINITY_DN5553_c0_g1_i1:329-925(-)
MENYSKTTRFAFTCNTSSKIIEPLQSRCAIMRFSRIKEEDVLKRIIKICQLENVQYTKEGVEAIMFSAEGDMRQVINNLQNAAQIAEGPVTAEIVNQVCDQPPPTIVAKMLEQIVAGEIRAACHLAMSLYQAGYNSQDIVGILFRLSKRYSAVQELVQLEWLKEIGLCMMKLGQGASDKVQVMALLAAMTQKVKQARG